MMTRFRPFFLFGALAVALAACSGGGGPTPAAADPTFIGPVSGLPVDAPGLERYIVMLDSDAADTPGLAAALAGMHGAAPGHVYTHALQGFAVQLPPAAAALLAADPRVALVETDMEAHIMAQTLPPGIDRAEADANAWADIDGVDTRVDVDIASIDTGVDLDHPDLNVYRDVTFVPRGRSGNDDNGHGSHTAGTMAALDNGFGVVGMAPGARLWAVKVLDRRGRGSWSDIIAGMDYVTANAGEIEVANMSLGSIGILNSVRTALQGMVNAGVVVAVSAGNSSRDVYGPDGALGTSDDTFPASYPEAMTVSAMKDSDGVAGGAGGTGDDEFASFTNYSRSVVGGNPVTSTGKAIDLAAPGVSVLSTYKNGGYATISGTSMSSPHVAGGAALYIAEHGRATDASGVAAIRQALIDQGQNQSAWQSGSTKDPDSNPERLLDATSGTANDTPVVAITAPADGAAFPSGASISFAGTATDTEDGDLSSTLAWVSDLDGAIGSGGAFSATLSNGVHAITASATDSGSKTGSDTISVSVGVNAAPVVAITAPTDGSAFASGATISFTGTATDAEDGDLSAGLSWTSSIDGAIGVGAAFAAALSDGAHAITASATDSGSKTGSDTISITVGTPALEVDVATDKASYKNRQRVKIMIHVTDGAAPVSGAAVHVELVTANGSLLSGDATTNANGDVTFTYRVNSGSHGVGTYTVTATADKAGFDQGTGSTTFEVTS